MSKLIFNEGIDRIWLTSGKIGNLGVFIPAELILDNVEASIYQLPVVSDAQLIVSMKYPDDFIELSKRGFSVYD